jgi:hypothetical protein
MHWTAQSVRYLRATWPTTSASVIARHLQASRSAVLGKARRLRLTKLPPRADGDRASKPAASEPPAPAFEIDLPPVAATTAPVPFLACEGCRWPLAGGLFCNAVQAPGRSYCIGHYQRAYLPDSTELRRAVPVRPRLPYWATHRLQQRPQKLIAQTARAPEPVAGRVARVEPGGDIVNRPHRPGI